MRFIKHVFRDIQIVDLVSHKKCKETDAFMVWRVERRSSFRFIEPEPGIGLPYL